MWIFLPFRVILKPSRKASASYATFQVMTLREELKYITQHPKLFYIYNTCIHRVSIIMSSMITICGTMSIIHYTLITLILEIIMPFRNMSMNWWRKFAFWTILILLHQFLFVDCRQWHWILSSRRSTLPHWRGGHYRSKDWRAARQSREHIAAL